MFLICHSTEWRGASSEDSHLHHCIHLIGGFADDLHTASSDPNTAFKPTQHSQKPGGCPFLLRIGLSYWNQSDRKPGKSQFSAFGIPAAIQ